MKKSLFILGCVLLSCLSFQSCKKSDEKVKQSVETVLNNEYNGLTSSIRDGVVTLNGTVATVEEKTAAENMIKSVSGVKSVVNNISVRPTADPMPVTTPTVNSDMTIKSEIEAKLMTGGYKDVKAQVNNGEVTLTGDLKRSDLSKVMQIANEAKPKKVTNQMNLK